MTKNVTLKLDEALLKKCRLLAVAREKSLSQWVSELIQRAIVEETNYTRAKKRALKKIAEGFHLGGSPIPRDQLHER